MVRSFKQRTDKTKTTKAKKNKKQQRTLWFLEFYRELFLARSRVAFHTTLSTTPITATHNIDSIMAHLIIERVVLTQTQVDCSCDGTGIAWRMVSFVISTSALSRGIKVVGTSQEHCQVTSPPHSTGQKKRTPTSSRQSPVKLMTSTSAAK